MGGAMQAIDDSVPISRLLLSRHRMTGAGLVYCTLFLGLALARADVNLKAVLARAAESLAESAGTSLDRSKFVDGLCFTSEDGGPSSGCGKQYLGKQRSVLAECVQRCCALFKT